MTPPANPRTGEAPTWAARHEWALAVAGMVPLLWIFSALYLPMLPNTVGSLPADFSVWLSELLIGDFWFATNGLWALPWFSPAICGGVPFFADPQVPYFSLTQAMTLLVSPMTATQATILGAAGAGFLGAYALARLPFRASPAAASLAGVLFMFNAYYATRMLIGHVPFAPFMLLPVLLLTALPWPGGRTGAWGETVRVGCGALLIAAVIEAGAVQLVVPAVLTAGFVLLLAGLTVGWSWRAVARLAAAAVLGAALSAGKLAASSALLGNYPRDFYALPGFDGLWSGLWLPVRLLFLGPPVPLQPTLFHDPYPTGPEVFIDQHEFTYSVTPIPAVLLLAAFAAMLVRTRGRPPALSPWRWLCLVGLLLLVAVPVAVNVHLPGWSAWLKTLPLLNNSSNLFRWFAAYILPVTLGAGLALDRLAGRHGALLAVPVAAASVIVVLLWLVRTDLSFYENKAFGPSAFPIAPIEQAWAALHAGGAVPPVVSLNPEPEMSFAASFTRGQSQLVCYWPLFGYLLERMRFGTLHPGDALAADNGHLNLRDPVCDVFPAENMCRPGDQFRTEDRAAAEAMAHYRPFPFRIPRWMAFAQWLNAAAALALAIGLPICVWLRWRRRRASAD